jgi:HEAT repeats
MLLSLALSLFAQNPTFHWDKSVDEKYWQALHLLEVDEVPSEAAVLLQGLIDEPSVMQFRGQAGYILAQAYRALLACGRKDSAEALLPSIRREIAGTEYEVVANSILERAQHSASLTQKLDPDFFEWVQRELIQPAVEGRDVSRRVGTYGKRMTPYLLTEIDAHDEEKGTIQFAFELGARLEDPEFFDRCLELTNSHEGEFSRQMFGRVEQLYPVDGLVLGGLAEFMVEVSKDPRLIVAQPAIHWLTRAAAYSPIALQRVQEIFAEQDSFKAQLMMEQIQFNGFAGASAIVIAAVESGNQEYAESARGYSQQRTGYADALIYLSAQGDRTSSKALLSQMCSRNPNPFYALSPVGIENIALGSSPELLGDAFSWLKQGPKDSQLNKDLYQASRRPFILRMVRGADSELALAACLVALQRADWPAALEYLKAHEIPDCLPTILPDEFPEDFYPYLERMISDSEAGKLAAFRLLRQSKEIGIEGMQVLAPSPGLSSTLVGTLNSWQPGPESVRWAGTIALNQAASPYLRTRAFRFALEHGVFASPELQEALIALPIHEKDRKGILVTWWRDGLQQHLEAELSVALELSPESSRAFTDYLSMAQRINWLGNPAKDPWLFIATGFIGAQRKKGLRFDSVILPLLTSVETVVFWDQVNRGGFLITPAQVQKALTYAPNLILEWPSSRYQGLGPETLVVLLDHPNVQIRKQLFRMLNRQVLPEDSLVLDEILVSVLQGISNSVLAAHAAKVLVEVGAEEDYVPKLILAWDLEDLEDRTVLVEAIGAIYDERLLPVLLKAVHYPEKGVARAGEKALDRYLSILEKHRAAHAWERAGQEGTPIDHLIEQLKDEKLTVRLAAIDSLGTLQAKEALPFLVDLLTAADQQIAAAAALALRKINHADSIADSTTDSNEVGSEE